eukprot:jgi/Chrzof1/13049/Cz07g18010.t1
MCIRCIMRWVKQVGRQLLSGSLNLVNTSFPVEMFEPRSYLQKLSDVWVYPEYINAAAAATDPVERMKLLVVWFVAGLHHGFETWKKPFNPILGETWQAEIDGGIHCYMEQISHHPPVAAYCIEGPGGCWRFSGWSQPAVAPVVKWYGIKTMAKGGRRLELQDGTVIDIVMPSFAIKGVVYATRPRAEVIGTARLLDTKNHLEAVLHFGPVKGSRHAVLRRADAVYGEIYRLPTHVSQGSATSTASGHTYGDAVAVKYSASDREASDDANSCEGADAEDERVFNAVGSSLGIAPVDSDPMLAHHPQKLEEQSDVLDTDRHADQDRHAHAVGMPATAFQAHAAVANGAIASKKMSSYTTQSHKHKAKHSLAAAKRSHTVAGELGQWGGAGDLGHHHRHGGGEGGVPGVPVAHIEGSWLSHINIDYKRYWTLSESQRSHWKPVTNPLPSDSSYRQDLAHLASGDKQGAQHWKEVMEQQQRADKTLRVQAGVHENH